MEEYIQVLTTVDKKGDAKKIANEVVGKRLAACAQIVGPVQSTYWWKGAMESSEEWLCLMKTKKTLYGMLEETIKKMHPYEVPEVVAVPIVSGNPDYLKWLEKEVGT